MMQMPSNWNTEKQSDFSQICHTEFFTANSHRLHIATVRSLSEVRETLTVLSIGLAMVVYKKIIEL